MTPSATDSSSKGSQPYIRLATVEDTDAIINVICRAFANDPVMNFLGSAKKVLDETQDTAECAGRRSFLKFLLTACFLIGGRITVVVDPSDSHIPEGSDANPTGTETETDDRDPGTGKIVATALWLPPNKRLAVWMVSTIIRAGVIDVMRKWGLRGVWRIVVDYQGTCESKLHHSFKEKGVKTSVDDSWYLQMTATDPAYQGRGLMSLLVREAFAHAPDDIFTLESTTAKSRDQYIHLGFENLTPIRLGKGKANAGGLAATGADATGLEIWGMAKWPSKMK